jgi:hypothetical protein
MRILVLLSLAALALAAPGTASAKVWFDDVQGQRYEPWQLVTTTMAGCQDTGGAECIPGISGSPVFAVPFNGQFRSWTCWRAARHARAGRITPRGGLRFRAPVQAGRYQLVVVAENDTPCWAAAASMGFRVVRPAR